MNCWKHFYISFPRRLSLFIADLTYGCIRFIDEKLRYAVTNVPGGVITSFIRATSVARRNVAFDEGKVKAN